MDVDSIPVGVNFRSYLRQAVIRSNVVLALISDTWLNVKYEDGPHKGERRIDDADDFVRIEIATALASGIPVIPLLTGRVPMPSATDLPDDLKALAYQQGTDLRAGRHYYGQLERLIRDLAPMLGADSTQPVANLPLPIPSESIHLTSPAADALPCVPVTDGVASRISNALQEIDAEEHGSMGSFSIRDGNSRRILGRLKAELASASNGDILQATMPHLDSERPLERWKAMRLLVSWKLASKDLVRRFWEKEPNWLCRQIVIEAAQCLGDKDRLDLLADVALFDDNGSNRRDALPHLTPLANGSHRGRVINILMELLDTDDAWGASGARPEALRQLRALNVPEAIGKAAQILREDKENSMRVEAAELLAEQGPVDTLLDIGEAFAKGHINDYVFSERLKTYLKRFSGPSVSAVISAMASEKSQRFAGDMVREQSDPSPMPGYFGRLTGSIIYENGIEQRFSGFRCFYSGRLHYSHNAESVGSNYQSASSLEPRQVVRIDFDKGPTATIRRGTVQLIGGKTLEKQFFHIGECSWWEPPGLQGKLDDPSICTLVIDASSGSNR